MTPKLLEFLCDPLDGSVLRLEAPEYDNEGNIVSGKLVSESGRTYDIKAGIPRFVETSATGDVESFGDEWNYFNFDAFKVNWLTHAIQNTFGSTEEFKGKMVVDAGAGSGMQTFWISQAGAEHVIALELSHSVDGVMQKNLQGCKNVDIVQCSIDAPGNSIPGMVICHNVTQHTRSVEDTANALWKIVGQGGEFDCYPKNDLDLIRKARLAIYNVVRAILSRQSFSVILGYAKVMSLIRFFPGFWLVGRKVWP